MPRISLSLTVDLPNDKHLSIARSTIFSLSQLIKNLIESLDKRINCSVMFSAEEDISERK